MPYHSVRSLSTLCLCIALCLTPGRALASDYEATEWANVAGLLTLTLGGAALICEGVTIGLNSASVYRGRRDGELAVTVGRVCGWGGVGMSLIRLSAFFDPYVPNGDDNLRIMVWTVAAGQLLVGLTSIAIAHWARSKPLRRPRALVSPLLLRDSAGRLAPGLAVSLLSF